MLFLEEHETNAATRACFYGFFVRYITKSIPSILDLSRSEYYCRSGSVQFFCLSFLLSMSLEHYNKYMSFFQIDSTDCCSSHDWNTVPDTLLVAEVSPVL